MPAYRSIRLASLMFIAVYSLPALAQQAPSAADGVLVSQDTLEGYTGRYVTTDGLTLKVWREGTVLKLQPEGSAPSNLVPDSETTFRVSGMNAQVAFVFDASNHVGHLLLTQGGVTVKAIHK